MPDPSIVHAFQQSGPATHVLVIGVGRYPHLLGGSGARLPEHQGLGQLTSPPESAHAVAQWFVAHFHNPRRPLGSVRLLVSEDTPRNFVNPRTLAQVPVAPATIASIEGAMESWKADGDIDANNLLIFYFCGHGLASGAFTSLLAEDFGKNPGNALDGAIDFYRNRLGMNRCKAKEQLYLVDACRTDADMTLYSTGYAGRVFVQPLAQRGAILRPVLYSTLHGQKAHGRAGQPSHFAEALIAAFNGAGSDRSQGDWRVRTTNLHLAVEAHLKRKAKAGIATAQISPADDLATFDVHHLTEPPKVPVVVSCDPEGALSSAHLRCLSAGTVVDERQPKDTPWELPLTVGQYDFEATFDAGQYLVGRRPGEYVYPPELTVPVPVRVTP
jgi:hypothetical protein